MKQKIMAHNAKDFVRKEKEQPVEKPADIGAKPAPSWVKTNRRRQNGNDNWWADISNAIGKKIELDEDGGIITDLTEDEQECICTAMSLKHVLQNMPRCE